MAATSTTRLDMCQTPQQTAEVNFVPLHQRCLFGLSSHLLCGSLYFFPSKINIDTENPLWFALAELVQCREGNPICLWRCVWEGELRAINLVMEDVFTIPLLKSMTSMKESPRWWWTDYNNPISWPCSKYSPIRLKVPWFWPPKIVTQ